jgi:hypothetical protein
VLTLRDQHPTWDARKRHAALTLGHDGMPSADTITAIWRRHGRLDATRSPPHSARRRFEHPIHNDPAGRWISRAMWRSSTAAVTPDRKGYPQSWSSAPDPVGLAPGFVLSAQAGHLRGVVGRGLLAGSRAHGYPLRHRDRRAGTGGNGCPLQTGLFVLWLTIGIEGTVTAGCSNNKYHRRQDPRHAMRGHYIESRVRLGSHRDDRGG